ncbi:DNA repair protein RecO [Micrococcus luteus]|uniref:DNA repair protein RecO n=1 Tax=Micrococcus luteus TaxID=1270 RepID=UPI000BF19851|nr:DNA repair protein RecO [Micrococcus luteus]PEH50142.1 DNA repair protein RecO [Micrococcus luteus]
MSGSGSSRRGARHGGYAANSFRAEAIVLRTHRLGEADRIIEALTPEHGLVRAVAKGVRKTSSRLGSVVEPFMHSTLQLARGRGELHTVSQAQLLHPYATMLAADYDAYTVAGALAEAVERVPAVDDDGRRAQYRLFHGALAALARGAHDPRLILHSFLLRALAQAGWAPTFDRCARCGAPGPHTALHVGLGGAVCPECRPPGAAHPAPETFDLLSALAAGDWATADASGAPARREAAGIVAAYLQFHAERRLVSLSVLDQDLGLPAPRVERRP